MKTYRNVIACAALVLATGFGVVHAQSDSSTAPASEQTASSKRHPGKLQMLSEKLNLTEAQKAQVAAILKEDQATRQAIRQDTTAADDVKKAKRKELLDSERAKIRALLTPEQQAKFDDMASHRGHRKAGQT
ncbi:hypothetical protein DB347_13335 [Opitutaceae bacterium EW11]|nr:hypothetical protein DB347_13335 [Opitutaceae bacterium EW11]